jgi:hypothetical protein
LNNLSHTAFVEAYRAGRVTVQLDPKRAATLLSARLLLPLITLPVLGAGVALALIGWLWSGLSVIAVGILVPRVIKKSAPHFLLTQALEDEAVYTELTRSAVMQVDESAPGDK